MQAMQHRARKRFGQNFLRDTQVIERIVRTIRPQPGQHCVEIGPGQGALTFPLLQQLGQLTAIELDRDLAAWLRQSSPRYGVLDLIEADVLKVDFTALAAGRTLRIIGNFPYNISSPLILHLLAHLPHWSDMHGMLQREVVERLAASPDSKDYSRLSVIVQCHCQVDLMFLVPNTAFEPSPKVESAVVRLQPLAERPAREVLIEIERIAKAAFSQRRKQLANTLKGVLDFSLLEELAIPRTARAEQLSVAQYRALAQNNLARRPSGS